ncbi:MAG: hypothetical protein KGL46_04830 [Hyphomicrobiales bacterium]|nr:hypothetical protein [Hyphomicrobiales bacterium]
MNSVVFGRLAKAAGAGLAAVWLTGCGGPAGSVGESTPVTTKIGNLLAFNSTQAPPAPVRAAGVVDCPVVQVDPGHSAVRVGGEAASSVRYQIAIGEVARECSVVNGQLAIRVGIETRTVIGPAGGTGSYTAPLHIALRNTAEEKTLATRVYTAGGSVGAEGTAIHTILAEPLYAPYAGEHTADNYEIVLSMGGGGERPAKRHRRRR